MSDDSELEAALDHLAETLQRGQRMMRRTLMLGTGALTSLGLLDAVMAVQRGDRFAWPNVVILGSLTVMGLLGWSSAFQTYRMLVKSDEMLMKEMRRNAALSTDMAGVAPLLEAIREAHSHGQPLMVMPADADEVTSAAPTQPPTHYLN
jgi:hypothetical protein